MKIKAVVLMVLGWAVPGLGHFLQRKYLRGAVFFGCLAAMTALGLALGGRIYPFQTENPLTILAFFADIGNGLLYLLSRVLPVGIGDLKLEAWPAGPFCSVG